MRMLRTLLAGPLIIVTALSTHSFAQQAHGVAPAEIAAAVSRHVAAQDSERAAIRAALARPEVRDVAERTGINLDRLAAAVDTISEKDLQRAAEAAQNVNQTLVGGATTIVISTTAIIIALLILLIIAVA